VQGGVRASCQCLSGIRSLLHRAKANASVTCPVEEGEYEVTHTVQLPREIPPGTEIISPVSLAEARKSSQIRCICPGIHCRRRYYAVPGPQCRLPSDALTQRIVCGVIPYHSICKNVILSDIVQDSETPRVLQYRKAWCRKRQVLGKQLVNGMKIDWALSYHRSLTLDPATPRAGRTGGIAPSSRDRPYRPLPSYNRAH
jgi:hypothetical protein